MEQDWREEIWRLMRDALEDVPAEPDTSFEPLVARLRADSRAPQEVVDALVVGLHYGLVTDRESRPFGPFGPQWQMEGQIYPRPPQNLGDVRETTIGMWSVAASETTSAMVRARFCDLLWVARADRPDKWARQAVNEYGQALLETRWSCLKRSAGGIRALEIARSFKDHRLMDEVVDLLLAFLQALVTSEDPQPGCAIPAMERILDLEDAPKNEIRELVEWMRQAFRDNVFILSQLDEISLQLLQSDEEREQVGRDAAMRHIGAASEEIGVARLAHLESALAITRKFGIRDLENQVLRDLRLSGRSEFGMHEISAEVSIGREQINKFVEAFVGNDSCDQALLRFGTQNPLGEPEETTAIVEGIMRDFPLVHMFPLTVVSHDGQSIRRIADPSERKRFEIGKHSSMRIQIFASFAIDILAGIKERYGTIVPSSSFFESSLIPEDLHEQIQTTFAMYERLPKSKVSQVRHVSLVDDSLGYDIVTPTVNSGESLHLLEVKTSVRPGKEFDFYLSRNEYRVGLNNVNWSLVCVRIVRNEPQILGHLPISRILDRFPVDQDDSVKWASCRVTVSQELLTEDLP